MAVPGLAQPGRMSTQADRRVGWAAATEYHWRSYRPQNPRAAAAPEAATLEWQAEPMAWQLELAVVVCLPALPKRTRQGVGDTIPRRANHQRTIERQLR